jgi:hypothetical protein
MLAMPFCVLAPRLSAHSCASCGIYDLEYPAMLLLDLEQLLTQADDFIPLDFALRDYEEHVFLNAHPMLA